MVTKMPDGWELVVGLEVHVELNTRTKMFSASPVDFAGEPNTRVFPIDAGLPGTLPVINREAVTAAARLGLAINCRIAETCRMHRKNYYYPDLPKGYQISQYDVPLCHDGWLDLDVEGRALRVEIERLHMEEDTGKSTHVGGAGRLHGADSSMIDFNRAGIPLLEIVSRPDIHDPETAQAYVRELQGIVLALGVSDARLEEGSMRCDANVSVRRPGEKLGTRREIKNVNSIRSIGRAIAYEAQAQIDELEAGGTIHMETRHWDESKGITATLRRKETEADYRYFPDPDLVEIACERAWVDQLRAGLPELPAAARQRLADAGVRADQAATLVATGLVVAFDRITADRDLAVDFTANALTNQVIAATRDEDVDVTADAAVGYLADALQLASDGDIALNKLEVLVRAGVDDGFATDARAQAESEGLIQVSDSGELQKMVDEVIARNPDVVAKIQGGAEKAIGALVGQVMGASKGQANPAMVNELLRKSILG